jgi:hypothetical protein
MGWSDYNVNWESPEYWRADCMEALRRAVNERCLQGIRNSVERTFTTIDNSLSVDRESGTVSFDANHFTSNPVVLTTQNYPAINETVKNLNL